ncbi:helix-turn-helix domain-containing protein [Shewanella canadensis]|uniref:Helix-turn-helix domain-containing protein n=1 Tax=Shewanella canadensis TaxID=271096 RepID=A0A431WW00_9GAMM|nr:AraC family transcriptional regulator ligand-binding domain-containing protein [Shewanella canadensis]RTR39626.1 helix-turn-helix domain-containing protein [Shewanella canadensis]
MTGSSGISFGRTGMFWLFLKAMDDYYGGCIKKVNLPQSLIDEPMRLMPLNEITRYFGILDEHINDPLFVAKGCSKLDFNNFPLLKNIVLSSPVLFTAIVRFNYLATILQSGAKCYTERTSQVTKWCYDTSIPVLSERLLDSFVAVWKFIHVLRHYGSDDFEPLVIHLPGSRLGGKGEAEKIFGCPIVWNAKRTEVWFDISLLPTFSKTMNKPAYNASDLQLLKYLNMPDRNDFSRCVFEAVDYARAYGYPKLEFIAQIMGVAPLTLQRKLQKENYSFSELVKYQLIYILAPNMLVEDRAIEDITNELGFSNSQSFVKAFKKAHQLTPKQYIECLDEVRGIIR